MTSLFHAITLVSLKVSRCHMCHMCIVSPTCSLVLAKLVRPFFNLLIFVLALEGFYMLELFFLIDRFMAAVVFSGVVSNSLICSASRCSMM